MSQACVGKSSSFLNDIHNIVNQGGVMNSSIAPIGIARRMILAIVTSREIYPGNFKSDFL